MLRQVLSYTRYHSLAEIDSERRGSFTQNGRNFVLFLHDFRHVPLAWHCWPDITFSFIQISFWGEVKNSLGWRTSEIQWLTADLHRSVSRGHRHVSTSWALK